jgi:hypothetical protein
VKVAGVLAFFSMGVYNEEQKRETRPFYYSGVLKRKKKREKKDERIFLHPK